MPKAQRPAWVNPFDIWQANGQKSATIIPRLPDNRIFTTVNKRTDTSSASIIGRGGVRAVMDTGAEDNHRINWTQSNLLLNLNKPFSGGAYPSFDLTQQDMKNAANMVPLAVLEANEFQEGVFRMPHWAPQLKWWYEERKAMYERAGKQWIDYGTYGGSEYYNGLRWDYQTGNGNQLMPNNQFFKQKIASVQNARSSCDYFSLFEPMGLGAIMKHYVDQADYAFMYYPKKYAIEVMSKGMGKTGGIGPGKLIYFDWGKIEGVDANTQDLHNGIQYERSLPNGSGKVRSDAHPQMDHELQVAKQLILGFCLSDGLITFDDRIRYGNNANEVKDKGPEQHPISWIPTAGAPAPITEAGYPTEPTRWLDAGYESAGWYMLTNRTEGVSWKQCRYRFAGSENWIEPSSDGTTTLEHASAFDGPYTMSGRRGRPDAIYREKNGAVDIVALDPSRRKGTFETIIMNPVPNVFVEATLEGCKHVMYNETI